MSNMNEKKKKLKKTVEVPIKGLNLVKKETVKIKLEGLNLTKKKQVKVDVSELRQLQKNPELLKHMKNKPMFKEVKLKDSD